MLRINVRVLSGLFLAFSTLAWGPCGAPQQAQLGVQPLPQLPMPENKLPIFPEHKPDAVPDIQTDTSKDKPDDGDDGKGAGVSDLGHSDDNHLARGHAGEVADAQQLRVRDDASAIATVLKTEQSNSHNETATYTNSTYDPTVWQDTQLGISVTATAALDGSSLHLITEDKPKDNGWFSRAYSWARSHPYISGTSAAVTLVTVAYAASQLRARLGGAASQTPRAAHAITKGDGTISGTGGGEDGGRGPTSMTSVAGSAPGGGKPTLSVDEANRMLGIPGAHAVVSYEKRGPTLVRRNEVNSESPGDASTATDTTFQSDESTLHDISDASVIAGTPAEGEHSDSLVKPVVGDLSLQVSPQSPEAKPRTLTFSTPKGKLLVDMTGNEAAVSSSNGASEQEFNLRGGVLQLLHEHFNDIVIRDLINVMTETEVLTAISELVLSADSNAFPQLKEHANYTDFIKAIGEKLTGLRGLAVGYSLLPQDIKHLANLINRLEVFEARLDESTAKELRDYIEPNEISTRVVDLRGHVSEELAEEIAKKASLTKVCRSEAGSISDGDKLLIVDDPAPSSSSHKKKAAKRRRVQQKRISPQDVAPKTDTNNRRANNRRSAPPVLPTDTTFSNNKGVLTVSTPAKATSDTVAAIAHQIADNEHGTEQEAVTLDQVVQVEIAELPADDPVQGQLTELNAILTEYQEALQAETSTDPNSPSRSPEDILLASAEKLRTFAGSISDVEEQGESSDLGDGYKRVSQQLFPGSPDLDQFAESGESDDDDVPEVLPSTPQSEWTTVMTRSKRRSERKAKTPMSQSQTPSKLEFDVTDGFSPHVVSPKAKPTSARTQQQRRSMLPVLAKMLGNSTKATSEVDRVEVTQGQTGTHTGPSIEPAKGKNRKYRNADKQVEELRRKRAEEVEARKVAAKQREERAAQNREESGYQSRLTKGAFQLRGAPVPR